MQAIHERVSKLETILGEFIVQTNMAINRMEEDTRILKKEMKDFKDEMLAFKNEMKDFKDEMLTFKNEMKDFKIESEKERREMNRQWGALANKMGTLVEDIISPSARPVIKKYFGYDSLDIYTRISKESKTKDKIYYEFDVVVVGIDKVFMIEVRSTPRTEYVQEILSKIKDFRNCFPEYIDKEVIPIFASLSFDNNVINYATKNGLYLMAYREWEYMDIINFNEVRSLLR